MKKNFFAQLWGPCGAEIIIDGLQPKLQDLEVEIKMIGAMENKVEALVGLFKVISPLQDQGGFSEELWELKRKNRRGKYNVEEIMGIIKELEIIIAMRLHSLIYAATQEVPMVGLSYDPKVDGILRSLNMDYICNVESLDYDELREKIDHVWTNRDILKEELKKQEKELKDKALSNVTMALDLLKG